MIRHGQLIHAADCQCLKCRRPHPGDVAAARALAWLLVGAGGSFAAAIALAVHLLP